MKKICREQQLYLEHRAQVENTSDIRDYRQLVGEHACVMIDMLRAMAEQPMRASTVGRIGARAERNTKEWHELIRSDGVDVDHADKLLGKATDELFDFMQSGKPHQEAGFLKRQHKIIGASLGNYCALGGRWRKHYDAEQHAEVARRIQQHWTRYVQSLLGFTRLVQRAVSQVPQQVVSDEKLYHHGTLVLLHAQALGQAWNDWTE